MGNEDAIVCKEKFDASKNCDCAAIESIKLDLQKTSLTDEKDVRCDEYLQPVEGLENPYSYYNINMMRALPAGTLGQTCGGN
ncbi:uncharacterized protein LOC124359276 isoform X2 [Homalodisca vitripennis]|uniref:uncharacterized protein LOC124359276 isoform X2 n=1 Tax=Homalodisca vitripennis TaxID=197043 RepID=UPI001EEBDD58|nr:uncharacterized protein LOC124359276 isoform X2 [Homalodisca vitripennis]